VADTGSVATTVPCSNLSDQTATLRWSFIKDDGTSAGSRTLIVTRGRTEVVSTESGVPFYADDTVPSADNFQGRVVVYSTQSRVFCSAHIAQPNTLPPVGIALHMVRFNPEPGAVE
jgi:hypothetical protein